jgi:CDP-diacylglycerol--serine O-phosphatidyltransferase
MLEVQDKRFFQGLSSTMAGGFVVSYILTCVQYGVTDKLAIYVGVVVILSSALLMVSNFRFYSFKAMPGNKKVTNTIFATIIVCLLSLIPSYKGLVILLFLASYILINLLLQPIYKRI